MEKKNDKVEVKKQAISQLFSNKDKETLKNTDRENRLLFLVLREELTIFLQNINSPETEKRRRFYEVDQWVRSRDGDWTFSFENICAALSINSEYIRAELARIKKQAFLKSGGQTDSKRKRRKQTRVHRSQRDQTK